MEYQAIFRIDGEVSNECGLKDPDTSERTETIQANNPWTAYEDAMSLATRFADDYLSNPNTQD